ncbi:pre-mRNA-splicing factor ISY1 homolog [Anopheles ziemanni]|uniref:pre-mRNA-splicing factor ISY1 homolog n=1 Tax=Anopheles coustani TaxID=139045 RepID=UPI0026583B4C|nr:pre-mRNA-splicing factor ISY1 homolog [Anopheles coustani]XP_058175430.1 pre-mRNA-splicing factor ISY1 homolog [Anopheles ziemanni]
MARNAEKAMTTLARWRAAKETETGKQERRPYLASECRDLGQCEKWRLEIIREISKKVAQIQNAGLGEFRIRDLNDEINKLLREKRHWENQISDLGGPHYRRYGPRMFDAEGREVPGNRGYKYFGAAKDLPGVRELFEQEPPPPPKKTRAELMKDIDADYYGYRDDDDGILLPLEEKAEKIAIQRAVEEWSSAKGSKASDKDDDEPDIYGSDAYITRDPEKPSKDDPMGLLGPRFTAHVPVPSQKDIEAALLKKRKLELMKKYGIEDDE